MLWVSHPSLPTTEEDINEEGWGGILAIAQTNANYHDALLCVTGEDRSVIKTKVPSYTEGRFELDVTGMDLKQIQSIEIGDRTYYQVATQEDLVHGSFVFEEDLEKIVVQC